jgi:CO dehydrogenase maturation factor
MTDDPLWIGVAGKGGSGKTVIAGALARLLARAGHDVVAMDSDPMPGLARALGVEEPEPTPLMGAVEKVDERRWRLRPGIGPVRVMTRFVTPTPDGVRLLTLGKADAAGLDNVIGAVNAFHSIAQRIEEAETPRRWTLVGDLPAGPRHIAAGFSGYARGYLVVVEPTSQSVLTARRVARLAREYRGVPAVFVANKVRDAAARRRLERMLGERPVAWIPADPAVAAAEREGSAPLDVANGSPAMRAIEGLAGAVAGRSLFPS